MVYGGERDKVTSNSKPWETECDGISEGLTQPCGGDAKGATEKKLSLN